MTDENKVNGSDGSVGNQDAPIKIGDKEFSISDVQNLVAQQATITQKGQQYANIEQKCAAYRLSPDELLNQADHAFSTLHSLIEAGVIDEQGNVVKAKQAEPVRQSQPEINFNPGQVGGGAEPKVEEVVLKALNPLLSRIQRQEEDINSLVRLNLQDRLTKQYPDLDEDDISRVLVKANSDRSKDLYGHAKELAEGKKGHMAKLEREIAAKYGIDVEKYNANKLKEQGAEGGAAAFYKSKKFSFDPRDKDAVSPREAAEEFLKLKFGK